MSMYRSASMYNSPYTWKPPPPKINYPPLFKSFTEMSFCRYVFDSKILAIAVLVLGVAVVVVIGMIIAPFWFQLVLDPQQGTFGSEAEMKELTIDTGIFYMRDSEFDNLLFTETFTGQDTLPKLLIAAHAFAVIGACILVSSFGAGVIMMLRRFASPTGLIFLAAAVSLTAFCEAAVIVLCGIMMGYSSCDPYANSDCKYTDNLEWRLIPLYSQFYRVEPHINPYVKPNWAFYIAIIGPLLCIAAAVLLWLEVVQTTKNLNQIRYQQLRQARDPYEKDIDPTMGRKYVYQPPTRVGTNMYGMQPVVGVNPYGMPVSYGAPAGHYYEGMVISPGTGPQQQAYIPPPTVGVRPPSPGFRPRGPASVDSSNASGQYVSREIDL